MAGRRKKTEKDFVMERLREILDRCMEKREGAEAKGETDLKSAVKVLEMLSELDRDGKSGKAAGRIEVILSDDYGDTPAGGIKKSRVGQKGAADEK